MRKTNVSVIISFVLSRKWDLKRNEQEEAYKWHEIYFRREKMREKKKFDKTYEVNEVWETERESANKNEIKKKGTKTFVELIVDCG